MIRIIVMIVAISEAELRQIFHSCVQHRDRRSHTAIVIGKTVCNIQLKSIFLVEAKICTKLPPVSVGAG